MAIAVEVSLIKEREYENVRQFDLRLRVPIAVFQSTESFRLLILAVRETQRGARRAIQNGTDIGKKSKT